MGIAFLFPGQGSQIPGMLHTLPDHPVIRKTLDEVSQILGSHVQDLDSASALESTVSVQLALLSAGVATARALVAEGVEPEAVAGLSVGAFAAGVQSGVVELSDAVRLVQHRAEMMVQLYPNGYGLSTIIGLTEQQVAQLVNEAHTDDAPVYLGNINAPRQIVIAGSDAGMTKVLAAARRIGARKVERLHVPVPSHCPLLEPVAASLRTMLRAITIHQPTTVYVGNVTARALRSPEAIAEDLVSNIAHGVRWFDATTVLEELGCRLFFEMPSGHVLRELAREAQPEVRALSIGESTIPYALRLASQLHDS
jgi:malonate decarboxylase epsilon subunit